MIVVTMKNVDYEDFDKICRICLLSENLESLEFKKLNVYYVFRSIFVDALADIENELPKNICQNCVKDLEGISSFLIRCKNSDAILKSVIANKKSASIVSPDNLRAAADNCLDYTNGECNVKPLSEVRTKETEIISKNNISDKFRRQSSARNRIIKKLFTCDYCCQSFERILHLQEHINIHLGIRPFKCNICGKYFTKRQTLKTHFYIHTGKRPYKCKLCEKSFLRKTGLSRHSLHFHGIENNDNKQCEYISTSATKTAENDNELITIKYPSELSETLILPMNSNNVYEKSIHVKETRELKEIKDEPKEHFQKNAGSFLCNICGKKFTRKNTLDVHIKIHTGEKNFECDICGFKFILKCTLDRHLAVHKKEKNFKCSVCGKGLSQKRYLFNHIQAFHQSNKVKTVKQKASYFCSICGKGFATQKRLNYHETGHKSDEKIKPKYPTKCIKNFLCTQCGKQFTFKCNLDRHILTIHSGKKQFQCNICGDKFTAKLSLDCHLNIHNDLKPYQCTHCKKSFRQPSTLRKHVLVHTGEREYQCHICDMAFKTNSHLKTHLKRHTRS